MSNSTKPVTCFLSFADSRMAAALTRIEEQAKEMKIFDDIRVYNEFNLDESFRQRWKELMKPGVRGFGYWCWKPYLMSKILKSLPDGSTLLYCDAGCHLNSKGRDRLLYYYRELDKDSLGIKAFPAFCSTISTVESRWTKGDVFDYFNCRNNKSITHSLQLASGHIFCRKSPVVQKFLEDWYQAWEDDFSLIDDSPSKTPNLSGFIENRHDQSIFSILYKLRGGISLPDNETEASDYSRLLEFPFWDLRDKGSAYKDRSILARLQRYLKAKRINTKIKIEVFKEKLSRFSAFRLKRD